MEAAREGEVWYRRPSSAVGSLDRWWIMGHSERVDRAAIAGELERTRVHLHRLLADASDTSLRSRSAGTRWTNEQYCNDSL